MWPSTPCACPAPTDQGAQHRDEPAAALLASWQRNLVVRVGVDRRRRPVSRPGGSVTSEQVQVQEFFAAHYPRLRRLGYWLTGSWVEAEDLAQEAMVRTSGAGRACAGTTGPRTTPARCWSTGIARCCAAR